MMKSVKSAGILAALLVGVFAFSSSAAAKCPDVPGDSVCPELQASFMPASPIAGDEVTVIAYWADIRTAERVTNVQWLAGRGKPAYLWLWDHQPSEFESSAYVEGMGGKAQLPQILVALEWDSEKREYQGTFMLPKPGRWYFRLGTLVPEALRPTMEADSDYVGPIQVLGMPVGTSPLFGNANWPIWPGLIFGSGLAISVLLWRSRHARRFRNDHSVS